ncbi:uncharacterized protein LOC141735125 isoform X1 [Larus michahellis]|uniref:uncharacterized protein LOC141735125 isoform X1 n=1 Tax=Larus michahellis TaxID=119627 RepID=UPI003D9B0695
MDGPKPLVGALTCRRVGWMDLRRDPEVSDGWAQGVGGRSPKAKCRVLPMGHTNPMDAGGWGRSGWSPPQQKRTWGCWSRDGRMRAQVAEVATSVPACLRTSVASSTGAATVPPSWALGRFHHFSSSFPAFLLLFPIFLLLFPLFFFLFLLFFFFLPLFFFFFPLFFFFSYFSPSFSTFLLLFLLFFFFFSTFLLLFLLFSFFFHFSSFSYFSSSFSTFLLLFPTFLLFSCFSSSFSCFSSYFSFFSSSFRTFLLLFPTFLLLFSTFLLLFLPFSFFFHFSSFSYFSSSFSCFSSSFHTFLLLFPTFLLLFPLFFFFFLLSFFFFFPWPRGRGGAWSHSKAHNPVPGKPHKAWRCWELPGASCRWYPSAEFRVVGPDRPLLATVGQDVVLPCHLSPRADARSLEIRWIRHQFSEIVHLYRNGEDLYGAKMKEYTGRTELVRDGLSGGTLDLRLAGVRPSDDGQYVCTVQDATTYEEAMVELEVAAMGSVPLISLEAHQDGGIRVVCGSAGWYPQPEVLWKAANGQRLPSVSQRRSSDERGLFEIQDVVVVSGKGDGNLSCVVRNSRLEQEQASSLHISAPFFHNARPWMAALGVFLVLSVASFSLNVYLWRRKVGLSRTLGESFWPLPPAKPPEKGAPWEGRGSGCLVIALWSLVWVDGAQKGSGEHWGWERGPGGDLSHGEKWGPVISQLKSG